MTELQALDVALSEDRCFHQQWEKARFEWRQGVPANLRKRRRLRHVLIESIRQELQSGELDTDKIVKQACDAISIWVVIVPVVIELVKLFVEAIRKRWDW